ncbi:MAG: porin family protein [Deltaproteobacteria bacterium]|nr:MAG: porin family protein [Deltaproteobacteria bacterium]TMB35573.1 MAG: porin family protein [Deltaproteobacteria bacterium]TMB38284.1 MAG: porin family protein [Deltaproteobacteria bacterium]
MRSFALGLVVVAAFPALAGVPEKGDGTITLLGGARQIPTGDYGSGRQHSFFQPGLVLGFGYQADDELHGGVQIGYMLDKYGTPAGTLDIRSIQILLQLDTALVKESWYTLYAGGGLGYSLNTSTRGGANVEANSTAGFIALGGRFRLTDHLAFVVEDRYTVSSAALDATASNTTVNVGGNFFGIGLQLHYFSSDDRGRPGD